MSPHVGNFVADLVEMAKATERLPQVEKDLEAANSAVEHYAKQVQDREIAILDLKNEMAVLRDQLRDMEVSRDVAELRFLEADDKLARVLNLVRGMGETLGQVIVTAEPERQPEPPHATPVYDNEGSKIGYVDTTAEPPVGLTDDEIAAGYSLKPVAKPEGGFDVPHYEVVHPQGQSAADPISVTVTDPHSAVPVSSTGNVTPISPSSPAPEVAAPTDPTVSSVTGDGPSPDSAAAMTNAETPADATSQEQSSTAPGEGKGHPQPYAGKNWSELPPDERPYTKEHWLSGGGSDEGWIS